MAAVEDLKGRDLTKEEVQWVLSIKPEDITREFLIDTFANSDRGKKFNTNDRFVLPKGTFNNDSTITTTIGRYIFNLFILGDKICKITGYVNVPINKKSLTNNVEVYMNDALLSDKLSSEDYIDYLNRFQWFGFTAGSFISAGGLSFDFVRPNPKVIKRRNELFKQYEKEIANNDAVTYSKIEKELINLAEEELKDDPAIWEYKTGEKPSMSNQYKTTQITKGPTDNNTTGGKNIVKGSYIEGVTKEELPYMADAMQSALFSKTQDEVKNSGYESKKLMSALQTVVLGEPGSDCGTKHTLEIELTPFNYNMFLYAFIEDKGKLVELTNVTIHDYIGKKVHLRTPMFCIGKKLCNKCAGNLYYRLGIKNVGITSFTLAGNMINMGMKAMHDTTVKVKRIDPSQFFVD